MERKIDIKKGLKEKQLAVEVDKYKSIIDLKDKDDGNFKEELNRLREEKINFTKNEQNLKEELIACRELLDAKDEELDLLNEKFNNLRRQRDELSSVNPNAKQNIRKDHIIVEETGKSATCSSND